MTQTRLPLFTTGIPQIVLTTGLDILDLRSERQQDTSRLVSLWLNYSSLNPIVGTNTTVNVWIQEGSESPKILTVATIQQAAQPLKLLDNFVLRGDVRLYLAAADCDLTAGDFVVAWGYYTLEGTAPRSAFELRPLQPNPNVIPESMGRPVVVNDETTVLHTVSDTQIDEIRLSVLCTPFSELPDPNTTITLIHFGSTVPTAPFVAGDGFISLNSAGDIPSLYSVSRTGDCFDGIPFLAAGELCCTALVITQPFAFPQFVLGSFTRT